MFEIDPPVTRLRMFWNISGVIGVFPAPVGTEKLFKAVEELPPAVVPAFMMLVLPPGVTMELLGRVPSIWAPAIVKLRSHHSSL